MQPDAVAPPTGREGERSPPSLIFNMTASVTLAYVLAITLLVLLVVAVGTWGVLASTRILDLLVEGGIIRLHDLHQGFVEGVPDISHYWQSQDPIDWRLASIAALLFLGYDALKALQFHGIARAYGLRSNLGPHARAYWYGDGIDRFLPFNVGVVGTAEALAGQGEPFDRALAAAVVTQSFVFFEIFAFGALGLALLGWSAWLGELLWAAVLLAAAYWLIHPGRRHARAALGRMTLVAGGQAVRWMAVEQRGLLVRSCLLSLAAFALLDMGVYAIMEAFNSTVVILAVEPSELLLGIVGGYVAARVVPVTPGGFGVFEWGFATGLVVGGADISLALVVIAVLTNILRNLTGGLLMGLSVWWYRVPTSVRTVMNRFTGAVVTPAAS